jgi:CubicO group peptidase (beta-lactamase class C family)
MIAITMAIALATLSVAHPAALAAQQIYATPTLEGERATLAADWIAKRMSAGFAGTVFVAVKGKVVLRGGFGLANAERGIPWSTSLVAPIGSVSKVFTAAAVMDLWDRRLLSPDDRLDKFFPEYVTAPTAAITLRQLLTHTSGLAPFSGDDFEPMPLDRFLDRVLSTTPPNPPGTVRSSNVGFSVLAAVVERMSGLPLDDYLQSRILTVPALRHIGYELPAVRADSMVAGLVERGRRGIFLDSLAPRTTLRGDYWNLYGGSGMQATAEALFGFVRAVAGGAILTKRSREALWAPQARRPDGAEYGFGWSVRRDTKGRLEQVSHSGSDGVFLASLNYFPQDELFVYVGSNVAGREAMLSATISGVMRIMRTGELPPP